MTQQVVISISLNGKYVVGGGDVGDVGRDVGAGDGDGDDDGDRRALVISITRNGKYVVREREVLAGRHNHDQIYKNSYIGFS